MSPLTLLIVSVVAATLVGIAVYLWMIKSYYWTKKQKEERRKQGINEWLD